MIEIPKKINEVGNHYGRLTVIREATKQEKRGLTGGAYWWCYCECGNTKMINGHSLRDGSTTSCGCYNKEIVSVNSKKKVIDEVGNRYGRLQVLYRDYNNEGEVKWVCRCDCGNIISVLANSLRNGKTISCGCYRKEISAKNVAITAFNNYIDEVGNVYGRLKVMEKSDYRKGDLNGVYYICQCECGQKTRSRGVDLRNGHIQSCGCLKSLGETQITNILTENNIEYEKEFAFPDLYGKSKSFPLRFDFKINISNGKYYLIEYNGKQHYQISEWFGGLKFFKQQQKYDSMKIKYCKDNNIPLIVIPYTVTDINVKDLCLETSNYIV